MAVESEENENGHTFPLKSSLSPLFPMSQGTNTSKGEKKSKTNKTGVLRLRIKRVLAAATEMNVGSYQHHNTQLGKPRQRANREKCTEKRKSFPFLAFINRTVGRGLSWAGINLDAQTQIAGLGLPNFVLLPCVGNYWEYPVLAIPQRAPRGPTSSAQGAREGRQTHRKVERKKGRKKEQ